MKPVLAFILSFVAIFSTTALAQERTQVWLKVAPVNARLIDPTKSAQAPSAVHITLPADYAITEPLLLSSSGFPYARGKKQTPFRVGGKTRYAGIYIGFYYGDHKLLAIHTDDVTTTSPKKKTEVYRTPAVSKLNGPSPAIEGMAGMPQVEALIREFHNTRCESLRAHDPRTSNMAREIDALFAEWNQFIAAKKKQNPSLATALVRAKELDAVARTITFEGHPISSLEQEVDPKHTAEKCRNPEDCPITSCEQKIVALTIRNRGLSPQCAQFGCRSKGDYFGIATKPNQFNIWIPGYTHRYIATCFLKDGVETAPPGNSDFEAYRNRARQFRFALDASARLLYGDTNAWGLKNEVSDTPIATMVNYYHPRGMAGCDPDTYDRRYSVSDRYARTEGADPDYALMLDETILSPGSSLPGTAPAIVARTLTADEKVDAKRKGERNLSYRFITFHGRGDSRNYIVDTAGAQKITSSNVCLRGGLASTGSNPNQCPNAIPQYYTAPRWGFQAGVEQMEFTCSYGNGAKVKLGGKCDSRMQPIGRVSNQFNITPFGTKLY